jgi:ketosteroid isomerase-like protein
MSERGQLLRDAFAAYRAGDLGPLERLFHPDAKWVGVPGAGWEGVTAECSNRGATVDRLRRIHANGRRFAIGEMIEEGDRVAVAVTIESPEWSGPVEVYKVFAFQPGTNVVVRMNDCIDESYARQVLAA